ncbi:6-pyruvoyltetrahydropterin/6-carboxytetrahydropterin synthase [Gammaproteobacteria bacterium]
MKNRLAKIEICKQELKFSAGHFCIFSQEDRENLHGHNYFTHVIIETEVTDNGISFNYGIYKAIISEICKSLDEIVLIPTQNPYLKITQDNEYVYAYFNLDKEKIYFLKRDVKLLPVRNITVEELSYWFLQELVLRVPVNHKKLIESIEVKIFSGSGQSGASLWRKT